MRRKSLHQLHATLKISISCCDRTFSCIQKLLIVVPLSLSQRQCENIHQSLIKIQQKTMLCVYCFLASEAADSDDTHTHVLPCMSTPLCSSPQTTRSEGSERSIWTSWWGCTDVYGTKLNILIPLCHTNFISLYLCLSIIFQLSVSRVAVVTSCAGAVMQHTSPASRWAHRKREKNVKETETNG